MEQHACHHGRPEDLQQLNVKILRNGNFVSEVLLFESDRDINCIMDTSDDKAG